MACKNVVLGGECATVLASEARKAGIASEDTRLCRYVEYLSESLTGCSLQP